MFRRGLPRRESRGEACSVLGTEWLMRSHDGRRELVGTWALKVESGSTGEWSIEERVAALERVVAWAVREATYARDWAKYAYGHAKSLEERLEPAWEVAELRDRVERLEEELRRLGEDLERLAKLRERVEKLSRELEDLEREVAALLLSRGVRESPVVDSYLRWFAREMLDAAGNAAELAKEIADPSAPLGSPLRRVRPEDAAQALRVLAKQREGLLSSEDYRVARRLVGLGLLKRLPNGSYAPTKFLRGLCALAVRGLEENA